MKSLIGLAIFLVLISASAIGQEVPVIPGTGWIDELSKIILNIAQASPIAIMILSLLGSMVVLGQTIVLITPTKKDDVFLEKSRKGILGMFIKLFESFAVIKKK